MLPCIKGRVEEYDIFEHGLKFYFVYQNFFVSETYVFHLYDLRKKIPRIFNVYLLYLLKKFGDLIVGLEKYNKQKLVTFLLWKLLKFYFVRKNFSDSQSYVFHFYEFRKKILTFLNATIRNKKMEK